MARIRGIIRNIDKFEFHKHGITLPIHLNKDNGHFFAEYLDNNISNASLEELKRDLFNAVQANAGLEWIPYIIVTMKGGSYSITDVINSELHSSEEYQRRHERVSGSIDVRANRYWAAKRPDGHWMKCDIWDSRDYESEGTTLEAERKKLEKAKQSTFLITCCRRQNMHDFYEANRANEFSLPYTINENNFGDPKVTHYLSYDESVWQALNAIVDKIGALNRQLAELLGTDKGRKKLEGFSRRLLVAGKGD